MINGAHVIIYSRDAEADRAFLRDVLGYPHVDVGGGWLIFKLPPAEVAVHPAETETHELYLMCDDLDETVAELAAKGVTTSPPADQGWGVLTSIRLPGGGTLGLYEPRHPKAIDLNHA
ncbi:VOC family protein [Nonomuraea sediminis]|uniref:VOC family protein n=1 Tax=Nonomuraea sediminis TaxID=2835864 RepID=UPI001BDC82E9|nr:extradiol dioxygenase [Nonomuraea sediminis]